MGNGKKKLQVVLEEAEMRHLKSVAAREGLPLREAILQAVRTWEAQLEAGRRRAEPAPRSPAAADSPKAAAPKPTAPQPASRPAGQRPSALSGGAPAAGQRSRSPQWLLRAGQLDWSKCPEAECVQGKDRVVWVVRGTTVPMSQLIAAVAVGHPLEEIAEAYEISPQQLRAIVQFVTTGRATTPG